MFSLTKQEQEWFDKAVERAKLDPRRAFDATAGRCSYAPQGDIPGCFIGYAVPIEILRELHDAAASENFSEGVIDVSDIKSADSTRHFLDELQRIHDVDGLGMISAGTYSQAHAYWQDRLRQFAAVWGLEWRGEW